MVDEGVHATVAGIQHTLLEVATDPSHPMRRQFEDLLTDWIVRLQDSPEMIARADGALEDPALLAKLDGWIVDPALSVVEQHRHEVGRLIEHTVSSWDPGETSKRLELAVGRDLQFVRINGTLVGGLVGLLLYAASRLAGHGGH